MNLTLKDVYNATHMHELTPVLIQQSDTVQHDVYAAHA